MFSADSTAILFLHSIVKAALCGDNITLSNLKNEIERDMKLMGVSNISQLSQKNLRFR